jgi:alkylhydroperoxidase/carboxymuconolactone decarboxylase family protein YurZ
MSLRERIAPDYERSFGFVPASVERRLALWERLDPEAIAHVEALRALGTTPRTISPLQAQLVTYAMLLAQGNPGAKNHALAAKRLGAGEAELAEIGMLAFLQAGIGALNLTAEILAELFGADGDPKPGGV